MFCTLSTDFVGTLVEVEIIQKLDIHQSTFFSYLNMNQNCAHYAFTSFLEFTRVECRTKPSILDQHKWIYNESLICWNRNKSGKTHFQAWHAYMGQLPFFEIHAILNFYLIQWREYYIERVMHWRSVLASLFFLRFLWPLQRQKFPCHMGNAPHQSKTAFDSCQSPSHVPLQSRRKLNKIRLQAVVWKNSKGIHNCWNKRKLYWNSIYYLK